MLNEMDDWVLQNQTKTRIRDQRAPNLDAFAGEQGKRQFALKDPRTLGYDENDCSIQISDEERKNGMQIIGSPDQGKSRLIEALSRGDTKRGYASCILDASFNGDTMYSILKWRIQKYKETKDERYLKVCIIDPHDQYRYEREDGKLVQLPGHIPAIAPRHNLMKTVQVLFGTTDPAQTSRIEKFLPSVFHILRKSGFSLAELRYFTDNKDKLYMSRAVRRSLARWTSTIMRAVSSNQPLTTMPFLTSLKVLLIESISLPILISRKCSASEESQAATRPFLLTR